MLTQSSKGIPTNLQMSSKLLKSVDFRRINHGIPSAESDNIKEVITNKFLRDSMERKVLQSFQLQKTFHDQLGVDLKQRSLKNLDLIDFDNHELSNEDVRFEVKNTSLFRCQDNRFASALNFYD